MELDVGLWSKLQPELLERLLSFLPVPILCKFRTVCKAWNSLICEPEFGNLCVQNANMEACFIVGLVIFRSQHTIFPRMAIPTNSLQNHSTRAKFAANQRWGVFDLQARRWYYGKNEFMEDHHYLDIKLATDGGLICKYFYSMNYQSVRISISNLFGNSTKLLPNPPLFTICGREDDSEFSLVVDEISHSYKIILINNFLFKWNPHDGPNPLVCIYESTTNRWRSLPNPVLPVQGRFAYQSLSSAMFQGLLYVMFSTSSDSTKNWLFKYNFGNDDWEDTGVQINNPPEFCGNVFVKGLIVSGNRLFMVSHLDVRGTQTESTLDISEILLKKRVCRTEFQVTAGFLHQNQILQNSLPVHTLHSWEHFHPLHKKEPYMSTIRAIQVFGFGKVIMLMSRATGKSIVYNLVTGSWDVFPKRHSGANFCCGKQMNYLRLPTTPLR